MPKRPRGAHTTGCVELAEYTRILRQWLLSDCSGVLSTPTIGADGDATATLRGARAAVAEPVDSGAATYDRSLNGWWSWYSDAATAHSGSLAALRERVLGALREDGGGVALSSPELQLARLPPLHDWVGGRHVLSLLADLRPHSGADLVRARKAAAALAPQVEHDDGPAAHFDFRWLDGQTGELNIENTGRANKGFVRLIERLCECARLGTRAVSLSTRIKENTELHRVCEAIAAAHGFSTECGVRRFGRWCATPYSSSRRAGCAPWRAPRGRSSPA